MSLGYLIVVWVVLLQLESARVGDSEAKVLVPPEQCGMYGCNTLFNQKCSSVNQSLLMQYKKQPSKRFHGGVGALVRAFDLHQLVLVNETVGDAHLVAAIKLGRIWRRTHSPETYLPCRQTSWVAPPAFQFNRNDI